MSHLAGVLDDGVGDCGIYINDMMGFYSRTSVQNNEIQALQSSCCDFIDVELPRMIV